MPRTDFGEASVGEADEVITDAMAKQEKTFQQAAAKKLAKSKDKAVQQISQQEESARVARLKFLIEKSKIYTSILSEKLLKQQDISRKRGADSDADQKLSQSQAGDDNIVESIEADNSKKSSNSQVTTAVPGTASRATRLHAKPSLSTSNGNAPSSATKPPASARQPKLITGGIMRDYQLAGLEWMVSLYENGLNGILADEMGLGKTLQTISFLAFLRSKGVHGPFLIAAPLSTIANWVNEVRRFAPDIPVLLYHGTKDERAALRLKRLGKVDEKFPIVVTSYEIIMNDRKFLQKYMWKYIVVDEGHRLKNLNCRLIRELKSYSSANRLLLTGTPLQNNLAELWSLLNFLLPDIFSDLESFQSWFDFSSINSSANGNLADDEQQNSVVSQLHQILKPFLLRRLKTDVEQDLPKKREYLLYAPMTPRQNDLYRAILSKRVQQFYDEGTAIQKSGTKRSSEEVDAKSVKRIKKAPNYEPQTDKEWFSAMEAQAQDKHEQISSSVLDDTKKVSSLPPLRLRNMLMSLRKACNHPFQMDWPVHQGTDEYIVDRSIVNTSGKMLLLDRLLTALFKEGHKVLIFSQFTDMLDIIQAWAEDIKHLHVSRIDGNVPQETRREQIADYNTKSDHQLFLLSTRAGGLGINLTSADTVILFDSDWNPQVDLQAMDRVHRIGQKCPVIVYRLVSANTIEAKILETANNKRKLEKVVIQKDKFKSIVSGAGADTSALLDEALLLDDAESIQVKHETDQVISDADLAKIMDRSDSAYEQQEQGGDGSVFKSIATMRDKENDGLAST